MRDRQKDRELDGLKLKEYYEGLAERQRARWLEVGRVL